MYVVDDDIVLGRFLSHPVGSVESKSHYPKGSSMRIYRIVHDNDGNKQTSALWLSYRSAVVSKAQRVNHADDVAIEFADVPETMWKPVDKLAEARATRLNNLVSALAWQDPAEAERLLQQLAAQVEHAKGYKQTRDRIRREAEEALSRLVDAE